MKELTGNLASEQLKQSQLKKKLDQKSAKIDDIQQRKREHVQQVRIKNERLSLNKHKDSAKKP